MPTEADTCRKLVVPKLQAAGWDNEPRSIAEQRVITPGRIVVHGNKAVRQPVKRADYLLRYTRDFPIAVVEAKVEYKKAADGLQQAKDYSQMLDLKFAYATNGKEIIGIDYLTGKERSIKAFPTPQELWSRLSSAQNLSETTTGPLLALSNISTAKEPRLLPENRHRPGCSSHHAGQKTHSTDDGNGHRQNGGRLSNLLEALVLQVERKGGSHPQAANSLPGRPQFSDG